jgi:hypothetical protein
MQLNDYGYLNKITKSNLSVRYGCDSSDFGLEGSKRLFLSYFPLPRENPRGKTGGMAVVRAGCSVRVASSRRSIVPYRA